MENEAASAAEPRSTFDIDRSCINARRAGAAAAAVATIVALASLWMPWMTLDVANQQVVNARYERVTVSASGSTNAWGIIAPIKAPTVAGPTRTLANRSPQASSIAGFPTAAMFLIAAALLTVVAAVLRYSTLAIAAFVVSFYARSTYGDLITVANGSPRPGVSQSIGATLFGLSAATVIVAAALSGAGVVTANIRARRAARAAGVDVPGFGQFATRILGGAIAKATEMGATQAKH